MFDIHVLSCTTVLSLSFIDQTHFVTNREGSLTRIDETMGMHTILSLSTLSRTLPQGISRGYQNLRISWSEINLPVVGPTRDYKSIPNARYRCLLTSRQLEVSKEGSPATTRTAWELGVNQHVKQTQLTFDWKMLLFARSSDKRFMTFLPSRLADDE